MDWVLEHFQLVITVVIVIGSMIFQAVKNAQGGEQRDGSEPNPYKRPAPVAEDPNARVRDIQAEIRRKIAERRAATDSPPPLAQRERTAPQQSPRARQASTGTAEVITARVAQQQQRLQEQLAAAEAARAAAKQRLAEVWQRPGAAALARKSSVATTMRPLGVSATTLRGATRDRAALRQAWVLHEVLDKPVAFR